MVGSPSPRYLVGDLPRQVLFRVHYTAVTANDQRVAAVGCGFKTEASRLPNKLQRGRSKFQSWVLKQRRVHEGSEVGQRTWDAGRLSSAYCHIETIGGLDCVMITAC
jgi:hypothetical protein